MALSTRAVIKLSTSVDLKMIIRAETFAVDAGRSTSLTLLYIHISKLSITGAHLRVLILLSSRLAVAEVALARSWYKRIRCRKMRKINSSY